MNSPILIRKHKIFIIKCHREQLAVGVAFFTIFQYTTNLLIAV